MSKTLWEKEKLLNGVIFCFPTMFSFLFYYLTFIHRGSPCFNPFPPAEAIWRTSSRRLLKTLWPKVSCLWWPQCFQLYLTIKLYLMEISYIFRFLSLGFQSRLLQICCMWERVKDMFNIVSCRFILLLETGITWLLFLRLFQYTYAASSVMNSFLYHEIVK